MLRKGVVEHIGAIMLVVISAAAIGGTINSIQSHTVEPSQQGLMDQIQQFNQEATIENEEQFRGLVVWNMMAGQQCVYNPLLIQWDEEYELDENDLDLTMRNQKELQDLEGREFTYYGKGDVLSELIDETDFSGRCMGADPISIDAALPAIADYIPSPTMPWEYRQDETALMEWEGQSAQGRFGRVDFEFENTVRLEDEELMAFHIGGNLASSSWNRGKNAPDFVRGERTSVFQPEGILRDESKESSWADSFGLLDVTEERKSAQSIPDLGERTVSEEVGHGIYDYSAGNEDMWREAMNAFRVRMVNVPTVTTGEFNYDDLHSFEEDKWRQQYRYVVQNTDYIICEGASGFVQSNAGRDIEESGKEYSDDNPIYRDVVYPRVQLRDQGNCLDDAVVPADGMGDKIRKHNEDFPTSSDPSYSSPSIADLHDGDGTYSVDSREEVRLGKDSYLPIYAVLTNRNARSLDLTEWWDIGNEQGDSLYRVEYAFDNQEDVCNSDETYDITKLHRVIDRNPSYEDSEVDLGQAGAIRYYTERFGEGNTFYFDIDTSEGSDWSVVFLGSSDTQLSIYTQNTHAEGVEDLVIDSPDIDWSGSERIRSQESYRVVLSHNPETDTVTLNVYGDEGLEFTEQEEESDFLKKIELADVISQSEGNSLNAEVEGKPKGCS